MPKGGVRSPSDSPALPWSRTTAAARLGYSSSGNIALQVALRHAELVRRALVYEPGYLLLLPDPENTHRRLMEAASVHLVDKPYDWAGAYAAVMRAFVPESEMPADGAEQATLSRGTTSGNGATPKRFSVTTSRF